MGQLREFFGSTRRNLATLVLATALLAVVHLAVPSPATRYGAWLVVFAVWMTWFVVTFVDWLGQADF